MRSIGGQLFIGLGVAGLVSGAVLIGLVSLQYGFFSEYRPPLRQTIAEIMDHVIIPLMVFVALFGAGAFIVVRTVAARLRDATHEAVAAAAALQSYRAELASLPAEVRPFAEALNALTARLEAHAKRQEAFAADAAHELKTPLAVIALELDKLSSGDAARLRRQVRAMSDMVDQLLLLARSNSPDLARNGQTIDLDPLCRRVVAELAPTAIANGKSIAFENRAPAAVTGLEEAIAAAVRTLADNALRATGESGEVIVAAGPGRSVLVLDGGEGLSPDALDRLKARGVRADRAPGGAAGLGLAIADRIVEAHGGDLQTCLPERPGLKLSFPAAGG